jgi:peptidoglycan/xylan/chitin deacetylase (PgdA/CDA1 family)
MSIIHALLDETVADKCRFLNELSRCAEVAVDAESLGRSLFMSWNQVRQLPGAGAIFTVGSHSHSHPNLAQLDEDSQHHELTVSKQILEGYTGGQIKALAYPYGWSGTYTERTRAIASQTGYRLAFASREGVSHRDTFDPWDISRLGVGSGDSAILLRARMALHTAFGRSVL